MQAGLKAVGYHHIIQKNNILPEGERIFCKEPFKYKALSISKCFEFISKKLKTFTEEKQEMS